METADHGSAQLQQVLQAVRDEHASLREWLVLWVQEQRAQLESQAAEPRAHSPRLGSPLSALTANAGPEPPQGDSPRVLEPSGVSPRPESDVGTEKRPRRTLQRGNMLHWEDYEQEMGAQRVKVQRILSSFDQAGTSQSVCCPMIKSLMTRFPKILPSKPPDSILARLVKSTAFNSFIVVLIVLNTTFMGVESDMSVRMALEDLSQSPPAIFFVIDFVFAICFLVELVLRLAALRLWFIVGADRAWNIFDMVLVVISIVQLALDGSGLVFLRLARTLRLIRVARIFRVTKVFGELRQLVSAMINAVAALAWSLVLLLLIMYTFAIIFLQGAQACIEDGRCSVTEIEQWYASLILTMYTLFQAISGGDWGAIGLTLTEYSSVYKVAWSVYIIVTMFCMLNILTGVFVSVSSEVQSNATQVRQKINAEEDFVRDMKELFVLLDTSKTGVLTRGELSESLKDEYVVAFLENAGLNITDFHTLFQLLDYNNSGDVGVVDFIAGCERLRGPAKSMYMQKLMLQVADLERSAEQQQCQLDSVAGAIQELKVQLSPAPEEVVAV